MRKTFQYRIYPTKKQETVLNHTLELCRELYNHLLEQRKLSWEREQKGLSLYDQINTFPLLKRNVPDLRSVHSQVFQDVARRIELAFQAFFRRVKRGEKPGYPRFKGVGRYDSFTYPQAALELAKQMFTFPRLEACLP